MKQALLDQLRIKVINDNVCPELSGQALQLVFGDGNANAKIVFIGEAPGKKEDETGLPFVGASGKFLNEMLASANLKREDVYITNIVKYRPPNNRDPSKQEKLEFLPYLKEQIEIIQPQLVVTLGRHSMEQFLPEAKISQVHGEKFKLKFGNHEVHLVPLYHPAAALYNGSLRQTLLDDFQKITDFYSA